MRGRLELGVQLARVTSELPLALPFPFLVTFLFIFIILTPKVGEGMVGVTVQ